MISVIIKFRLKIIQQSSLLFLLILFHSHPTFPLICNLVRFVICFSLIVIIMLQVSTSSANKIPSSSVNKLFCSSATCLCCAVWKYTRSTHLWLLLAKGITTIRRLRSTLISSPQDLADAHSVRRWGWWPTSSCC